MSRHRGRVVGIARRVAPTLAALAAVLLSAAPARAFDVRVRSTTLMAGRDRPALVMVPDADVRSIRMELTRADGGAVHRSGGPYRGGEEVVFEWDQPPGRQRYSGTLTVVYADGQEGFMEPAFTLEVLPPLEVRVPREEVDLDAHTLVAYLDRPAGKLELTVVADTGAVIDEREFPLGGEAPGTPLAASWHQADETVIRIDVRGYDEHGFWAGVELSPWFVEIPHEEVVFDTGSAVVRPDQAPKLEATYALIDEAVRKYGHLVQVDLYVVGYTDTQGTNAFNQTLSESRARSIAHDLRRRGFSGDIFYQGFGEEVLAVATPDETDEERNRRAVYVLAAEMPPLSSGIPAQDWKPLR